MFLGISNQRRRDVLRNALDLYLAECAKIAPSANGRIELTENIAAAQSMKRELSACESLYEPTTNNGACL